jgi:hypothetical protein
LSVGTPWRYVYASVAGTSHTGGGVVCQDASLVQMSVPPVDEAILLVASDGAGSARKSDVGSHMVCSLIAGLVSEHLGAGATVRSITIERVHEWIGEVVEAMRQRAYAEAADLRDLACTLLVAVVGRTDAVFVQVGDGAIVVGRGDEYSPVFWPQNGEYANTTFFLTDEAVGARLQFLLQEGDIDEVAVLTDGLQMLALHNATRSAHVPFFRPLFSYLRLKKDQGDDDLKGRLCEWLNSEAVNGRTDDDKTLILATRVTGERASEGAD